MGNLESEALAVLRRITEQYLQRDLTREEVIQIRQAITQHLTPLMTHPHKVFILGSYQDDGRSRLKTAQSMLNSHYRIHSSSRGRVFRMEDIPGNEVWINLDIKFRLLADISDNIIGIAEHDGGGFVFEQGILATNTDYRNKTLLLKREYDTTEKEHKYFSAMQSNGFFPYLEKEGRIFRWRDDEELIKAIEEAFQYMESE